MTSGIRTQRESVTITGSQVKLGHSRHLSLTGKRPNSHEAQNADGLVCAEHCPAPRHREEPCGQELHSSLPACESNPALHGVQADPHTCVPRGQGRQCPFSSMLPGPQPMGHESGLPSLSTTGDVGTHMLSPEGVPSGAVPGGHAPLGAHRSIMFCSASAVTVTMLPVASTRQNDSRCPPMNSMANVSELHRAIMFMKANAHSVLHSVMVVIQSGSEPAQACSMEKPLRSGLSTENALRTDRGQCLAKKRSWPNSDACRDVLEKPFAMQTS